MGIEPTRPEGHRILSPARLPVPPLRRSAQRHVNVGCRGGRFSLDPVDASRVQILPACNARTPVMQMEEETLTKAQFARVLALLVAALALVAAGCGGDDDESATAAHDRGSAAAADVQALPSSSCTAHRVRGRRRSRLLIASDLPLQGSSRTQTTQIVEAIRYLLEAGHWKAGDYRSATSRVTTRPHRPASGTRPSARRTRTRTPANEKRDRRRRHVQLRLRSDHHPGAQPGTGRRRRDGLAGQHVRLPDRGRPGLRRRPSRTSTTRPATRNYARVVAARRLPGRGGGGVRARSRA